MAVQINVQANQAALAASIAAGVANFNNSLARTNQLNLQVNAISLKVVIHMISNSLLRNQLQKEFHSKSTRK